MGEINNYNFIMFFNDHFPKTLEQLDSSFADICAKTLTRLDKFYDLPNVFGDVVYTIDDIEYQISKVMNIFGVYQLVHPEKEFRDKSIELSNKLSEFVNEHLSSNIKIYEKFCRIKNFGGCNEEEMYHYEEEIKGMKLNGLHLDKASRDRLTELKNQVSLLTTKQQDNSRESESKAELLFSREELDGVPEDILGKLDRKASETDVDMEAGDGDDGDMKKYVVKADQPTYVVIMGKCNVEATRRAVDEQFKSVGAPENFAVFEQIFKIRHEMANIVGYEDYADMAYHNAMPGSKEGLDKFYGNLMPVIKEKAVQELKTLREYFGIEGDIASYDFKYYREKYQATEFGIDSQRIKRYFPTEQTINNILSIYEMFLGVKLKETRKSQIKVWHEDVRCIELYHGKELKGYILCDLYPRDGKYSHACCCDVLNNDATTKEGVPSVATLVMNCFSDFMTHDNVETFLHEFGHAIHQILGTSRFKQRGGFNTELDFVECPSQLLEEWAWEPEMLGILSNGEIPEELVERILRNRFSFIGYDTLRQIYLGKLSYHYHTKENAGLIEVQEMLTDEIMGGVGMSFPDYSRKFVCNFGHLTDYSACYYSYLWSKVYAVDIFCEIKKRESLLDSECGEAYIESIIGKGGSVKPIKMVEEFLGRDVDYTKFAAYCSGKL